MIKYIDNEVSNPTYLFHGSSVLTDELEPRKAHDTDHNPENEDCAVFLSSSFIVASAYAFQNQIAEMSEGLKSDFCIGYNPDLNEPIIIMKDVIVSDDIEGYIYVFPFNENYEHHGRSQQYKCHEKIKPIEIIKVKFSDFKEYYQINNIAKRR